MRRQLGWTILGVVALVALMFSVSCDYESGSGSSSSSNSSAARDTSAEDRRRGFHCLDAWDGNHNGMEALIRDELNDPGSMETIETGITPVDADGQHTVRLEFTAKNAFGGRVRHTAYGWVDQASCRATLGWIE